MTSSKLNASGMRWVSELANFKFDIKYRPGKISVDCDYLSRNPVQNFEQLADNVIKLVYSAIVRKERPLNSQKKNLGKKSKTLLNYLENLYLSKDEILFKKNKKNDQLVLPKRYDRSVFRELHENMGYLGYGKVQELVKERFY